MNDAAPELRRALTSTASSALRIVIEPTTSGRKWIARLDDRVLCIAAAPFVQSARALLAEGYPADAVIEMWRPHTTECALRGRLRAVAATMMDGERSASTPGTARRFSKRFQASEGAMDGETLLHGPFLAATALEFRPGRVSKTKRRSTYITKQQAMNLMEALKFADSIGYPLNVSIDIFWEMFSGFTDERTRLARCQERISKWSQRRGFRLTMIWVREIGKNGGRNTHILMHVPPWLMEDAQFEAELQQELERALEPVGGPTHEKAIFIQHAPTPEGKLRYMLKGMRRRDADQLYIRRASFQGELEGKRVGMDREHRGEGQEKV